MEAANKNHKKHLGSSSKRPPSLLCTFLYEAMSIISSQPLTMKCLSDPPRLMPLMANHLLTMNQRICSPPPRCFTSEDIYKHKLWRQVQYMVEQFLCNTKIVKIQAKPQGKRYCQGRGSSCSLATSKDHRSLKGRASSGTYRQDPYGH